ncbi:MAG: type II toxin-antitoxin system RelE/ParE family toxin, partial [Bacteroidetes bacterium]|nr:type II toxin-antitoxin system RelE/ParE family toxin [Bacteroidota bacterium]
MVRVVIWSAEAQKNRVEILSFWNNHNKSNLYSKSLNRLFVHAVRMIAKNPELGKKTEMENVRLKIVRNYYIIYRISEKIIEILI